LKLRAGKCGFAGLPERRGDRSDPLKLGNARFSNRRKEKDEKRDNDDKKEKKNKE